MDRYETSVVLRSPAENIACCAAGEGIRRRHQQTTSYSSESPCELIVDLVDEKRGHGVFVHSLIELPVGDIIEKVESRQRDGRSPTVVRCQALKRRIFDC